MKKALIALALILSFSAPVMQGALPSIFSSLGWLMLSYYLSENQTRHRAMMTRAFCLLLAALSFLTLSGTWIYICSVLALRLLAIVFYHRTLTTFAGTPGQWVRFGLGLYVVLSVLLLGASVACASAGGDMLHITVEEMASYHALSKITRHIDLVCSGVFLLTTLAAFLLAHRQEKAK